MIRVWETKFSWIIEASVHAHSTIAWDLAQAFLIMHKQKKIHVCNENSTAATNCTWKKNEILNKKKILYTAPFRAWAVPVQLYSDMLGNVSDCHDNSLSVVWSVSLFLSVFFLYTTESLTCTYSLLAPRLVGLQILCPELPKWFNRSPCWETESPSAHCMCGAIKAWQV